MENIGRCGCGRIWPIEWKKIIGKAMSQIEQLGQLGFSYSVGILMISNFYMGLFEKV